MTTVIVVALANLFFGLCCLAVYECVRRKTPVGPTRRAFNWATRRRRRCPPITLTMGRAAHASGRGADPSYWVGYDVLVYLRFQALALKIFGSFAPYAVILLIVNMSASYDDGPSLPNLFTRLSLR